MKLSELIQELEAIKRQHGDVRVVLFYPGEMKDPSPSLWVRHDKDDKVIDKVIDLASLTE